MQRILAIVGVCGAIVFGSGCSHTGGCSSCGCPTGGCAKSGGLFGFGGCQHVGGKCDCAPDSVQGTCNYYGAAGTGTNVQAAPAAATTPAPAGGYEAIPAPKTMPKGDGK